MAMVEGIRYFTVRAALFLAFLIPQSPRLALKRIQAVKCRGNSSIRSARNGFHVFGNEIIRGFDRQRMAVIVALRQIATQFTQH